MFILFEGKIPNMYSCGGVKKKGVALGNTLSFGICKYHLLTFVFTDFV